jgi:glycosyltransferase involved in cell wall biosynthesis
MANGLDVPPTAAESMPPAERFVFVGRLSPEKDFDTLFHAVSRVDGAHLDVVGDGVLRHDLVARADTRQVSFHGSRPRPEVDAFLAGARALILCSTVEGLPNAVLEALAAGRPVIVTAVGSLPEIVMDGDNGYVVQPGDSQAIAAAMRNLQDDDHWRRMAQRARQSVERFSWGQLVPEVEQRLQTLAEARSGKGRTT